MIPKASTREREEILKTKKERDSGGETEPTQKSRRKAPLEIQQTHR